MIPAAEHAYIHTKRMILDGSAAGGTLLSEAVLGAQLGISRTPVHEAFLRLSAEGLLTLAPRRGAVVAPMSPREAENVLDLREAIEATAARRIIENNAVDVNLLDALRDALSEQSSALDVADVDRFVEADQWFHAAVVDASGNDLAAHFFGLLRDRQQRIRHQLFKVHPETLSKSLADHEALLGALRCGSGYSELLHAHIAQNRGAL